MAVIDYAFLADFARVEPSGSLTVLGASFTFVDVASLPAGRMLAIAGRVRAEADETVELDVSITAPQEAFRIGASMMLEPGPGARPYGDNKLGHLFAMNVQVPLPTVGLYVVELKVDDSHRRLAFEVVVADEA